VTTLDLSRRQGALSRVVDLLAECVPPARAREAECALCEFLAEDRLLVRDYAACAKELAGLRSALAFVEELHGESGDLLDWCLAVARGTRCAEGVN
jgi:hypothetical protein